MSDLTSLFGTITGGAGSVSPRPITDAAPAFFQGVNPSGPAPVSGAQPADPITTATTVQADTTGTMDPVLHAYLQQLEYVKPQSSDTPAARPQVTTISMPGQDSGSGSSPLGLIAVLVVLGIGAFFIFSKAKKHGGHSEKKHSGVTHVEV